MEQDKRYKLLKDINSPQVTAKAGDIGTYHKSSDTIVFNDGKPNSHRYNVRYMELHPEWFEEIKSKELLQVPVERNKVLFLTHQQTCFGQRAVRNIYDLETSNPIPTPLIDKIKEHVENILNDIPNPYNKESYLRLFTQLQDVLTENVELSNKLDILIKSTTNPANTYTEQGDDINWLFDRLKNILVKQGNFELGTDIRQVELKYKGEKLPDFPVGKPPTGWHINMDDLSRLPLYETKPTPTTDKQDEWEIIEFVVLKSYQPIQPYKFVLNNEDSLYYYATGKKAYDELINHPHISIHSVRRGQDVFTIGDMGCCQGNYFIITEFRMIEKDELHVWGTKEGSEIGLPQCGITLIDKPSPSTDTPILFTTEDGVEIREGDSFCYIDHMDNWKINWLNKINSAYGWFHPLDTTLKTFSTEDNAKQYIIDNQPCLSRNEVMSIVRKVEDATSGHDNLSYINNELFSLITQKTKR